MFFKLQRLLPVKVLAVCLFFTDTATAQTVAGIFPRGDKPNGLLFFGLTILALFFALVVHESGHLLAGIVNGFRFQLFIVGLLGVRRVGDSIQLFVNKNIAYMGGIASTVPVHLQRSNRRKFALVVAAGPIASFLFFLIDFLVFFNSTSGMARGFWFVAGTANMGIFLATTLPKKSGIFFTDRARFQRLMNKGKVGEIEEALLTIIAMQVNDGACANLPLPKVRLLQTDTDRMTKFWGHYYEYCYFNDNGMAGDREEAKRYLYSLKNTIPAHLWTALKIDQMPTA